MHDSEEGMPIHEMQTMFGDADISPTTTYLNATQLALQESLRKRDERRNVCRQVAKSEAIEWALFANQRRESIASVAKLMRYVSFVPVAQLDRARAS